MRFCIAIKLYIILSYYTIKYGNIDFFYYVMQKFAVIF